MGEEKCLDCGREINGPLIRTPDGDTYHYTCVGVEYPEEYGTERVLNVLDEEESPLYHFFKFLDENPYESIMAIKDEVEPHFITMDKETTINLFGHDIFSWNIRGSSGNVVPILLQAVSFGGAMERDYPAFADRDELYPNGNPRVPSEEEELSDSED